VTYDPGRMKERVIIQRLSESRVSGEIINIWSTLATVWAEVIPRGSRESYRQSQVISELEYLVRIRRYDGLTTKDRITWGSRALELVGVVETMADNTEVTELYCVEVDHG
jgi:SPP1 family predicted phage head-tail adaptor